MTQSPLIKVMSFNIRYGLADDGENHWDKRKHLTLARIHDFEPDLLGMQECRDDEQAVFVKTNLPDYHFLGVHRNGGDVTDIEMAPILFRQAVFEIIQTGYFWLSKTPDVAGSKSWGSEFARTVTWTRLIHRATNRALIFVNTHFDYQPTAINGATQCLNNWLHQVQKDSPVIVTGDFNTDKESAAYRLLTSNEMLFDAYRQAHPNPDNEATFHGFGQQAEMTPIDWILVSEHFQVVDAKVDRSQNGNLFPSDHFPVLAKLEWRN